MCMCSGNMNYGEVFHRVFELFILFLVKVWNEVLSWLFNHECLYSNSILLCCCIDLNTVSSPLLRAYSPCFTLYNILLAGLSTPTVLCVHVCLWLINFVITPLFMALITNWDCHSHRNIFSIIGYLTAHYLMRASIWKALRKVSPTGGMPQKKHVSEEGGASSTDWQENCLETSVLSSM